MSPPLLATMMTTMADFIMCIAAIMQSSISIEQILAPHPPHYTNTLVPLAQCFKIASDDQFQDIARNWLSKHQI